MFHARGAAAADDQRRIVTRARLGEYALGHVVEVLPDFSLDMGRFDASFHQKLAGFVEETVVPQGRRQLRQDIEQFRC